MTRTLKHFLKLVLLPAFLIALVQCDVAPTEPDNNGVNTHTLFVMHGGEGQTVSAIDLETGVITHNFQSTGSIPGDITIHNGNLLILNSVPASLQITSVENGIEIETINLTAGSNPYAIETDEDWIYVTGLLSGKLYRISPIDWTIVDSIGVGSAPEGMADNQDYIFVATSDGWQEGYTNSSVHVISKATFSPVDTISTGTNPQRLAWSENGKLHVLCTGNYSSEFGIVTVIDPVSLNTEDTILLGGSPGYICITKDNIVYVSDFGVETDKESMGYLYSYDASNNEIIRTFSNPIEVGYGAMGLLYSNIDERLFISNYGDNTVQVFHPDSQKVVQTYQVDLAPQELAIY